MRESRFIGDCVSLRVNRGSEKETSTAHNCPVTNSISSPASVIGVMILAGPVLP